MTSPAATGFAAFTAMTIGMVAAFEIAEVAHLAAKTFNHGTRKLIARGQDADFYDAARLLSATRSCAGNQSSISLTLSPMTWSEPPQQPQISPAMSSRTSSRGR
jgi:hypothetical protein